MNVRGLTLVEVAVALTIGGLVALTASATVAALPDLSSRADSRLSETIRAASVRTQLRDWLRASYATADSTYDGAFTGIDGSAPGTDALRFPVLDPMGSDGGRATIVLGIDAAPDGGSALVAEVRQGAGPTRRIELVPGATHFEARYLYFVSDEPRWFAGWSSKIERPAAVRLWVGGEALAPLMRLPLTVWLLP